MTFLDRMSAAVEKYTIPEPNSGCWLWFGASDGRYGEIWIEKKRHKAHRASYTAFVGQIPAGMNICHKCNTPACINPAHLYVGTHADNMRDRERAGRNPMKIAPHRSSLNGLKIPRCSGEKHGLCKLTDKQVLEMRALHARGVSTRELGRMFNVGHSHAARVVSGKRRSLVAALNEEASE